MLNQQDKQITALEKKNTLQSDDKDVSNLCIITTSERDQLEQGSLPSKGDQFEQGATSEGRLQAFLLQTKCKEEEVYISCEETEDCKKSVATTSTTEDRHVDKAARVKDQSKHQNDVTAREDLKCHDMCAAAKTKQKDRKWHGMHAAATAETET
eukprot:14188816-Ditylum_brightwellii.AAC.1